MKITIKNKNNTVTIDGATASEAREILKSASGGNGSGSGNPQGYYGYVDVPEKYSDNQNAGFYDDNPQNYYGYVDVSEKYGR